MIREISIIILILLISCGTRESKQTLISEDERKVLFTVTDLIENGYKYDQPSADSEIFNKVMFDDGFQLTYKYETPESAGTKYLTINTSLRTFNSKSDATQGYYGILTGSTLKSLISDKIEQREKKDARIHGDNSKILEFMGKESQIAVGYALVCQLDNKVYLTYFMAPYIENIDVWTSILPGKLANARNL